MKDKVKDPKIVTVGCGKFLFRRVAQDAHPERDPFSIIVWFTTGFLDSLPYILVGYDGLSVQNNRDRYDILYNIIGVDEV